MKKVCIFFAASLLWLAAYAQAQTGAAAPSSIPVERFFQVPLAYAPTLSPDTKSVALLTRIRGRLNVFVYDIDTRKGTAVTSFDDQDVVSVNWVNDKRLVFSNGNVFEATGAGDVRRGGLYAVDRDGTGFRRLGQSFAEARAAGAVVYRATLFGGRTKELGDDIFALSNERSAESFDVYRMNTRTGRRTLMTTQLPARVQSIRSDQNDAPRMLTALERTTASSYFWVDEQSGWQKSWEGDFRQGGLAPVAVDFDGKTVYALSNLNRDAAALVQWDPTTKQVVRVVAEQPGHDVVGPIFDGRVRKLVGVRIASERGAAIWLDEGWKAIQRSIDTALPNAINYFVPPDSGKRFLIVSYSDKNPGTIYVFDEQTRKIEFLFDVMPDIKPEQMADTKLVKYTARDGLTIPALLTTPKGSQGKNFPMILHVHGGPWIDADHVGWHAEAQFLASRGYAVLRPQFRGTTGLGLKHWVSSFKQWGGTMQDDLTDGVQWAIKQGIADPKRVCIMGASYGGYAAMQGLVSTPELYRCGINLVGVTDLLLQQTMTWSDSNDTEFAKYLAPIMIGDVDADRNMMIARSPARNAEKINVPVLMFYGSDDRRVPIDHMNRMATALTRAGKPFHAEVMAGEGHGFGKLENRVKTYTMIEAFLKESLK